MDRLLLTRREDSAGKVLCRSVGRSILDLEPDTGSLVPVCSCETDCMCVRKGLTQTD